MKYININSMVKKCFILLFASILMISGCKKFLEEIPTGNLTDLTEFKTQSDLDALTLGPYRNLTTWTGGAMDWGNYLPNAIEYLSGFAYTYEPHVLFWRFETNQVSGDLLGDFDNQWTNWYRGIRDANFSILTIEKMEGVSSDNISRSLAEVRTIRAWFYFNLVRYFGDVPLITGILESIDDAETPRVSLKTIYDEVIIPDLEFAIASKLADKQSSDGRVTKHVARALAADVYLTCAGYPYQEVNTAPDNEWCVSGSWSASAYPVITSSALAFLQKAKTQLDMLYGEYELGTYDDLRDPALDNKGEHIWGAQFVSGFNHNSMAEASFPLSSHISMFGDERGTYLPSVGYYGCYDDADLRKQERQFWFNIDRISKKYDPTEPVSAVFDRPHLFKFYADEAVKVTGQNDLDWNFYRYADILLMLTEVNWTLKQHGQAISDADLIKGINEVRDRALLPAYLPGEINLFTIMSERAYELIFENKMLWDQRRTRICLTPGTGSFGELHSFFGHRPESFSFNFDKMNLLSPLGGSEIKVNKKLMQNYGYLPVQIGQ